jgi:hypothetical protein
MFFHVDVAAITDWSNITLPEGVAFGIDGFDVRVSLKSTGWPFCSPDNVLLARYFLLCSGCGSGNLPDGTPSESGADFPSRSGTTVSVAVNTTAEVDGAVDKVVWTAVSPQKALSIYQFEFPNFKESMDLSHMLRISLKQPPTITASPTPSVKPRWPPDEAASHKAQPLPELTMVIIIVSGCRSWLLTAVVVWRCGNSPFLPLTRCTIRAVEWVCGAVRRDRRLGLHPVEVPQPSHAEFLANRATSSAGR